MENSVIIFLFYTHMQLQYIWCIWYVYVNTINCMAKNGKKSGFFFFVAKKFGAKINPFKLILCFIYHKENTGRNPLFSLDYNVSSNQGSVSRQGKAVAKINGNDFFLFSSPATFNTILFLDNFGFLFYVLHTHTYEYMSVCVYVCVSVLNNFNCLKALCTNNFSFFSTKCNHTIKNL